jgi:glyoxylase-like metal-dependent hydrolase (beta-lactamase superfamily II)
LNRKASPDESLISDDGLLPADSNGLVYPLGERTPATGELIALGSGVRWARLPLSGDLGHINIWLVDDRDEHGEGVAIVDTGMSTPRCRAAWDALLAGPLAGVRITRVVVTHFHPDHVGMAGWLCDRFGVPLWITREEWMIGSLLAADAKEAPPAAIVGGWRSAGWNEDQIGEATSFGWSSFARMVSPIPMSYIRMRDGDVLDFAGEQWRVTVGRGHAPEHACLLNERAGLLIAGDQILPTISSNVSVPFNEPMSDPLGDWLESIDQFLQLPSGLLVLPSHGEPFTGIHLRLAALRDRHHERLDVLLAHLSAPRRVVDCFGTMFRREIQGFDIFPATGEALAHLRWLECRGRVSRSIDAQGVGWFSAIH